MGISFRNYSFGWVRYAATFAALALTFGPCSAPAWAQAQQDPANQPAAIIEQPGAQATQPATTSDQSAATSRQPAPANVRTQPAEPTGPEHEMRRVPMMLTLKRGTIVSARTSQFLSSDQNHAGDGFTAELEQPIVVDGWVVARRGQTILGRIAVAQKAGRVKGTSQLGIELTKLILVDGQQMSIHTQLMQMSGDTSKGRDAEAAGTTTGMGAAIGAAANGGEGAAIGAGIGAAAGIAGVLLTRGRPTVIPPETSLTFELETPIAISTARSGPAFRAVEPADYSPREGRLQRRPHLAMAPFAPYGPGPYYNPWFGPWGYPAPFYFGFNYFGGRRHFHNFRR
jgi:hypothetical protein